MPQHKRMKSLGLSVDPGCVLLPDPPAMQQKLLQSKKELLK